MLTIKDLWQSVRLCLIAHYDYYDYLSKACVNITDIEDVDDEDLCHCRLDSPGSCISLLFCSRGSVTSPLITLRLKNLQYAQL